jgi:hypothetical protein
MNTTAIVNRPFSSGHSPGNSLLGSLLVEPALTAGAAGFWLFALPFVALALMSVKVWESMVALSSGRPVRPNPLILRYGPAVALDLQRDRAHAARF